MPTTDTMSNLLTVLSRPDEHSPATAKRWAAHVLVAAMTCVALDPSESTAAYDTLLQLTQQAVVDYSRLLKAEAVMNYGTNDCAYCGEEFTTDNPCWNDEAAYPNGTHLDGECKQCAAKNKRNDSIAPHRKSAAGGTFERGE